MLEMKTFWIRMGSELLGWRGRAANFPFTSVLRYFSSKGLNGVSAMSETNLKLDENLACSVRENQLFRIISLDLGV